MSKGLKRTTISEVVYRADKRSKLQLSVFFQIESIMGMPRTLVVEENDYSQAAMEWYGREVDSYVIVEGEDLVKLANKFQAKDDKTLMRKLVERFAQYRSDINSKFKEFCDVKNIKYSTSIY